MRGLGLTPVGKGDAATHLRPTSDRVREAIFNLILSGRYGDPVTDAEVLDVFAGTGALGLEALSRGAARVTFIDSGRIAVRILNANIEKARVENVTRVIHRDATHLGSADCAATLVFLDPPYGRNLGERALAKLRKEDWLAPSALVVWEEAAAQDAPEGFARLDQRRYGDTHITILRHSA